MHSLLVQRREVKGDVLVDFCHFQFVYLLASNCELLSVLCSMLHGLCFFSLAQVTRSTLLSCVIVCCSALQLLLRARLYLTFVQD